MARNRKKTDVKTEFLWVEKYRPQSIEDCILPDRIKDELRSLVEGGELVNLMLSGTAGIGKTTVAKALANDLDMESLVINASKDGNIDTLRTTIQTFAMSKSFEGKKKVVILDEADHLNPNSTQPALRNFIEEFSRTCRFIFTCNYPKKIIEPLHSRTKLIHFNFSKVEQRELGGKFMKRFRAILDAEGIEYDKATVAQFLIKYSPDYRKALGELQGASSSGKLDPTLISSIDSNMHAQVAEWIANKQFTKLREWVAENVDMGFSQFMNVRRALEPKLVKSSIPDMFVMLNEYDRGFSFATDPEIHFMACISSLMFELEYKTDG